MALMHAAVCGDPIAHSLSPVLHSAAYAYLGIDAEYDRIRVDERELASVVAGLDDSWLGLSLTMPLKEVAREVVGPREPIVDDVESANTIYRNAEGEWALANTDVEGARAAIAHVHGERNLRTALVLGAGATARSVVRALPDLGVRDIVIAARRSDAASALADRASAWGLRAHVKDWSALTTDERDRDLVVSALPGDAEVPSVLHQGPGVLLDVAYHPWPTPLAATWVGPVASGRDMLVGQAVRQILLMTGYPVPAEVLYEALTGH